MNASKRIMQDLKEIQQDGKELAGFSISPLEDNLFTLHANILIQDGPYKDMLMHICLILPPDYPYNPPAGYMAENFPLTHRFHEHIHVHGKGPAAICNDLLSNYKSFFSEKKASGWSPGFTLKTILLQLSTFFIDPDLPKHLIPSDQEVEHLRERIRQYQCPTCKHTTQTPEPPLFSSLEKQQEDNNKKQPEDGEENKNKKTRTPAQDQIIIPACGINKVNIMQDSKLILGYPMLVAYDDYRHLTTEPILELIGYDAYMTQIQQAGFDKLDFYDHVYFKSVTGQYYNHWIPIYINEDHFRRAKTYIQNAISIVRNGPHGVHNHDFRPEMILDILPNFMNKMVIRLLKGEMYESAPAIHAYCHFLRLFMGFLRLYPSLQNEIEQDISLFLRNPKSRGKRNVKDLGEWLIKLAFSKKYRFQDPDLKEVILQEFLTRQCYWMKRNGVSFRDRPLNLSKCFESAKLGCQLLIYNLEMIKTFIFDGVDKRLDQLNGYPPTSVVSKFQTRIRFIKQSIQSFTAFFREVGDKKRDTSKQIESFILRAYRSSSS